MTQRRKSSEEILKELEAQPDGLQVRPIKAWSLEKLAIVHLYLSAFTRACGKAGGGVYVDGLAGPGICEVQRAIAPPRFVFGSPLLALRAEPEFQKCYFVELNKAMSAALEARIVPYGARAKAIGGDANIVLPELLHREIHPRAPCFCLLDPEGMELAWTTVRSISQIGRRTRAPELLILFPSTWLLRLLPRAGAIDPRHDAVLSRVMPNELWRQVYKDRLSAAIEPSEAKDRYAEIYREALEGVGYRAFRHRIEAPSVPGGHRRERYQLIFATQHPTGEEIMADVFARPYVLDYPFTAQTRLWPE